jgi:hypothetical protein
MHAESIPDFTTWMESYSYYPMPSPDDNERIRFMGLGNDVETVIYYKTGVTNGRLADALWSAYLEDRIFQQDTQEVRVA